jgi:hypothetical protein
MFFQQMKERYSCFLQRQTNAEENFILGAIAAAGSVCGTFFIRIYTSITLVLRKQLKCTIHYSPIFVFFHTSYDSHGHGEDQASDPGKGSF